MPVQQSIGVATNASNAGAPVAGSDEVQTITIGGTPTGGTFRLTFMGQTTAAITWSNVNATLIAAIDAALEALTNIGVGNVLTAAGTVTAGIGTITVTFNNAVGKQLWTVMTAINNMTGTSPTVTVAQTTPGVTATGRGYPKGKKLVDTTNAIDYINTGTPTAPTWTKTGTQT